MNNKKILYLILIIAIIGFSVFIKEYQSQYSLIKMQNNVYLIRIFNLENRDALDISKTSEITKILKTLNNIKVKKVKPDLSSEKLDFLISTYGKDGETLETFYISEDKLVQYHWVLNISNSEVLYRYIQNQYK